MPLPGFEQITEHAQIARGDCLELLREIPAGSVDMVLTDLPYQPGEKFVFVPKYRR